uniref:Uncharacterized protein n=1 Tax=Arundo donax TaxID=35708 RepID=A0A0A9BZM1_ARUDO
MLNFRIWEAWR